jgi:hypothetical protein
VSFPLKNPLKSVSSYSSSLPKQISWGDKSEAQDAVSDDDDDDDESFDEQCKQMYIAYAAAGGIAKMFADSKERAKRDAS